jgi:hypothetical protein
MKNSSNKVSRMATLPSMWGGGVNGHMLSAEVPTLISLGSSVCNATACLNTRRNIYIYICLHIYIYISRARRHALRQDARRVARAREPTLEEAC